MKEIYLAMDWNNAVFGFDNMPIMPVIENGVWMSNDGKGNYPPSALLKLGIDITKFPLTHETPIKIRAVWEQIND